MQLNGGPPLRKLARAHAAHRCSSHRACTPHRVTQLNGAPLPPRARTSACSIPPRHAKWAFRHERSHVAAFVAHDHTARCMRAAARHERSRVAATVTRAHAAPCLPHSPACRRKLSCVAAVAAAIAACERAARFPTRHARCSSRIAAAARAAGRAAAQGGAKCEQGAALVDDHLVPEVVVDGVDKLVPGGSRVHLGLG